MNEQASVNMPDKWSWLIVQDKISLKWNVKKIEKFDGTSIGYNKNIIYEMMEYHFPANPHATPDTSPQRKTVIASVKPNGLKRVSEELPTTPQTYKKKRKFVSESSNAGNMPLLDLTCHEVMCHETIHDNNSQKDIGDAQGETGEEENNVQMQIVMDDSCSFEGVNLQQDFFGHSWLNEDVDLMLDDQDNAEVQKENATGNVRDDTDFDVTAFLL